MDGNGACKGIKLIIIDTESILTKFPFALFEISATAIFSSQV